MTKAEQETLIRWDEEEKVAHLWTAYGPTARKWLKLGYPVKHKRTKSESWSADVPVKLISFRRAGVRRPKRVVTATTFRKRAEFSPTGAGMEDPKDGE